MLFNESIRYNLMYSRPDATVKEMKEAAKAAAVYDTIMAFPKKFDTKVGERGLRLSGGEKQVKLLAPLSERAITCFASTKVLALLIQKYKY